MPNFADASRVALAKISRAVAQSRILPRSLATIASPSRRYVQPLRLIDGMSAAPEPCLLPQRWAAASHPRHAVAQPKIDGIRALYIDTSIVSREALPLDVALHCLPALAELEQLYGEPMVFDGEYVEPGGFRETLAAWRRGEGCGRIFLFDAVPYREWRANRFTERLEDRVTRMCRFEERVGSPFLRSLGLTSVPGADDAMAMAEQEWARGGEGIVVKSRYDLYSRGKSRTWQKLKRTQTFDGPVVDALIKSGRCQAIMVCLPDDSAAPGKVVRIGSNIPEDLREAIARAPEQFIGSVAEIAFVDTNDIGGLLGGYFVRMRPDKGN